MKIFINIVVFILAGISSLNSQWVQVASLVNTGTFPNVSVVNSNLIFIAGGPNSLPFIARSTNGGTNFLNLPTNGLNLELYSIWAIDENNIFVGDGGAAGGAGGNAKIYKTINAGINWTNILSTGGTSGFINGIVFSRTNPQIGIIQSDPPTGTTYWIAKTTNSGDNWIIENPSSSGAGSAQNSVVVIDQNFYAFGLNQTPARVGLTSNGGNNWTYTPLVGLGGTSTFISGFAFNTDKINGLASNNSTTNAISRTTNGGISWFQQIIPNSTSSAYCNIKYVPGTNICYIILSTANGSQSFRSTNNGTTWTSLTMPPNMNITHFDLTKSGNSVTAFAVSNTGVVLKLTDNITDINEYSAEIPSRYYLSQNFPNPFNPVTQINYSVSEPGVVQISVYNVLGERISDLVNEYKKSGNYSVIFDSDKLSGGVYFYSMNTNGFLETKKMILTK